MQTASEHELEYRCYVCEKLFHQWAVRFHTERRHCVVEDWKLQTTRRRSHKRKIECKSNIKLDESMDSGKKYKSECIQSKEEIMNKMDEDEDMAKLRCDRIPSDSRLNIKSETVDKCKERAILDKEPNSDQDEPSKRLRRMDENLDSSYSEETQSRSISPNIETETGANDATCENASVENDFRILIQNRPCIELPLDIKQCLDCHQLDVTEETLQSHCCRFKGFRKLGCTGSGIQPLDANCFVTQMDDTLQQCSSKYLNEWLPSSTNGLASGSSTAAMTATDPAISRYIISHVAPYFSKLYEKEWDLLRKFKGLYYNPKVVKGVAYWKPPETDGARELCDFCSTTIFNVYLFCEDCGFSVCRVCIEERYQTILKTGKDSISWPTCVYARGMWYEKGSHAPGVMTLAYMIPECKPDVSLSTLSELDMLLRQKLSCMEKKLPLQVPTQSIPYSHVFLFDGELLLFRSPELIDIALFQEKWTCSKPVIVENVHTKLSMHLWAPMVFMRIGQENESMTESGFIDCRTGMKIKCISLKQFWQGFLDNKCRSKDTKGRVRYLKLKDFPPKDKFSTVFPEQYKDFCSALPIPQYTHPELGCYNLATKLPPYCLPPDLGPKMYTAYEMVSEPMKGTTNLHLDVSDAVNVLVNVTTPASIDEALYYNDLVTYLSSEGLDENDLKRATTKYLHQIGALWTIYRPEHNSTIRSFLRKLVKERDEKGDPIHDQQIYLNRELRLRLETEHGVKGFTFIQMLGDAVFIPAGAAHQVQNLQCCIKIAEDFVSPEGVHQCAIMSDEFRSLSDDHSNHEDKLQLPNIVAHSVRESLAILENSDSNEYRVDGNKRIQVGNEH